MDLSTISSSFAMIFLAEVGDKTQLTAMALALRFPWRRVVGGICLAFALLNILAVVVGSLLFAMIPLFWIKLISGGLFVLFGINALRGGGGEDDDGASIARSAATAFRTAFLMILFAEMGDKTQIVTASLAARSPHMLQVFVGSTAALVSVALLGIFLGKRLMERLPLPLVHRCAGIVFLLFGALSLRQAFQSAG